MTPRPATVGRHTVVEITYTIQDLQGRILEQCDLPVAYVHGVGGPLLEKIERALEGRAVGDRVEVTMSPEEGFGPHRPELTFTDDIDNVPPPYRRVGAEAEFANERGEVLRMRVTRIEGGKLTLDGNHPFAGMTLRFVVEVVGVREASPEEINSGVPRGAFLGFH
ncbi:MAG: peptidylprolyl isomerase [Azospira oryzae]|uniref:peptidylprolyl isomerase n=1 Tax=Pelomicrobium methylotrophicum TaxID=2602750 RepID=A0A5C7ETN2_9PROT|nr:peptidylprolyl isomerase [Pelomicrobium methylotrophicum]PZP57727.1 MAG: peptidylprolyl isomerase [Azospira oryzae]PZP79342.1 MAG: peptidylprolyl isomerase [Azospira oryzae]TXF12063.1 peptidylprolyl isomerase [Pelomicrobium methylotrophicum]